MLNKMSTVQKVTLFYGVAFFALVFGGLLPGVIDDQGMMLGLFAIDPIDDALHLASGIWAVMAAQHSVGAVLIYTRWFGTIYFLDGLAGILAGTTFLDLGFLDHHAGEGADWAVRLGANIPHVLIGLSLVLIGVYLGKKK